MKSTDIFAIAEWKNAGRHSFRGWRRSVLCSLLMGALYIPLARADDTPTPANTVLNSTTQTTTIIVGSNTVTVGPSGIILNGKAIVNSPAGLPPGTQIVLPDGTRITVGGAGTTTVVGPTTPTAPTIQTTPAAPEVKPPVEEIRPEVKLTPSQLALKRAKRSIREVNYSLAEQQSRQLLASAKTPRERGDALMLLGQTFYSRHQYDLARTQWNRAAALKAPEIATRAHASIARSYVAQENLDAAIAQYKIALTRVAADSTLNAEDKSSDKLLVSLPMAAIYFKRGQLELARQQFSQIAKSSQADPKTSAIDLMVVGAIEILQKNPQMASTTFRQAAKQLAGQAKNEADFQSKLQQLSAALDSLTDKDKLSRLSGPEIGNKLLEILVSSFGDDFDSLFDADFDDKIEVSIKIDK